MGRLRATNDIDLLVPADVTARTELIDALQLLGVSLYVCGPEDLILLKLKAGRPHDFEDVLGIIKNPHVHVDLDYLWSWADRLGIQRELSYVLHAADTGG